MDTAQTTHRHLPLATLELTEKELEALLWVRENLATKRLLLDHKVAHDEVASVVSDVLGTFDMNLFRTDKTHSVGCGTVGCIAGWMSFRLGLRADSNYIDTHTSHKIEKLFYPNEWVGHDWEQITAEMAVQAIDNFLKYGDPFWNEIDGV